MVELFNLIERTKSIKIKCDNLSYWRADTPNNLINYIVDNIEKFDVEVFDIEQGRVFDDIYIKSFDIEIYMTDDLYNTIMSKYQNSVARYNKDGVDLSLYRHRLQE